MKINKIRDKSNDKVSENFFSESINTSNSKINRNEIQNKVNKYYRLNGTSPLKSGTSQLPSSYDIRSKESFGSSYKDKMNNIDKYKKK